MHVVRHTQIHLFNWVHSYECGQAHLGLPKIILNIKFAIYQDSIELWCCFFAYGQVSTKTANWYSDFKWLTVTAWFLTEFSIGAWSVGKGIPPNSMGDFQSFGGEETLRFPRKIDSFGCWTFWISFGYWWYLEFVADVP